MTTESDRELLEAAAKAAGMWGTDFALDDEPSPIYTKEKGLYLSWGRGYWNPLTDDGDALRLAVKLGIAVYPPETKWDDATVNAPGTYAPWISEPVKDDLCAATRRSIVRAAAAIGAQKEQA